MAASPPLSPAYGPPRPVSAMIRPNRSESRTSSCSKQGGGSRESDDDVKTSVRVGAYSIVDVRSSGPPGRRRALGDLHVDDAIGPSNQGLTC